MIPIETIIEAQEKWEEAAEKGGAAAENAARAALLGFKDAVAVLLQNLAAMSYPAVSGVTPPEPGLAARIAKLEATYGAKVPPALVAFWEIVGGVSLIDVEGQSHSRFWESHDLEGLHGYSDGLLVYPCDAEMLADYLRLYDPERHGHDTLEISPDGNIKDYSCGGEAYAMAMGGDWLTPIEEFAWPEEYHPESAAEGPCDLISYLRTTVLECAGFPAFLPLEDFEPFRAKLLKNVPLF
jgi:hypothetical protein